MAEHHPQQDEEAYWRSSKEFVRLLIAELNETLKAHGVWRRKRKQICTSFVFSFCNFVDHQWFKPGGRTQYPLLGFATNFFDIDVPLDLAQINFPHKSVELHGMVHDEIEWFFEEMKENRAAVPSGDVGQETADVAIEEVAVQIPTLPCWTCKGTGHCFCIRKGSGDPAGCPRCQGSGHCQHCGGSGIARHV